jgi:hypothetical protein
MPGLLGNSNFVPQPFQALSSWPGGCNYSGIRIEEKESVMKSLDLNKKAMLFVILLILIDEMAQGATPLLASLSNS